MSVRYFPGPGVKLRRACACTHVSRLLPPLVHFTFSVMCGLESGLCRPDFPPIDHRGADARDSASAFHPSFQVSDFTRRS